jgi:hypothetical protein
MPTPPDRCSSDQTLRCRLIAAAFLLAGCSSEPPLPETFPVSGKVFFEGGEPLHGGFVQFTSTTDSQFTVAGSIQVNGTFTLSTVVGTRKVLGALPGKYQVRVTAPQHKGQPMSVIMPVSPTQDIEPKDNELLIAVRIEE